MTKIEEIEQKLNEMNEGLEVGIKKFQEQITDFNNELRIAKEDFLDELNECQKALAELKESKKEGKWKPKHNEEYYFRGTKGYIENTLNYDSEYDDWRINNIPIFKTEEQCKKYWHFMDTVKEKSYEFSRDDFENDNFSKYMIAYNFVLKDFYVDCVLNRKYFGEIYFKDEEDAKYIINNFKEELLEYWI